MEPYCEHQDQEHLDRRSRTRRSSATTSPSIEGYRRLRQHATRASPASKAVDDYTLEVTLKYPFADFPYVVAHPALAPVPQKHVEEGVDYNGKKVPFGDMPVGNGPFKMAEPWKHNQYIKVVANEDYYGTKAQHRRHRLHDLQGPEHRVPRVPGRHPRLHPDR